MNSEDRLREMSRILTDLMLINGQPHMLRFCIRKKELLEKLRDVLDEEIKIEKVSYEEFMEALNGRK